MRKGIVTFLFLILTIPLSAQGVWTVKTIPNTRLESDLFHVSDPDDIIADSCEQLINTSLDAIREQADVFVVALNSIGDADIDLFANELFNYWGIGESGQDNGVLILLAKEQHDIKFETGYGVEEILTDARCQDIFLDYMVPYFKEDDYQSGLCAGVIQIVDVFGGEIPDGLITILPTLQEQQDDDDEFSGAEFLLVILLLLVMPFLGVIVFVLQFSSKTTVTGKSSKALQINIVDGVRYVSGSSGQWDGNPWGGMGCLKGLLFGFSPLLIAFIVYTIEGMRVDDLEQLSYKRILLISVLVYFTWTCIRQNWRALRVANKNAKTDLFPKALYEKADNNTLTRFTRWLAIWVGWIFILIFKHKINKTPVCQCLDCGSEMNAFNRFHFSEVQQKEMALKSVGYTPYICPFGHVTIQKSYPLSGVNYKVCPACQGRTAKVTNNRVVQTATYDHSGLKEVTHHCEFCGHTWIVQETIAKLVHSYSSSSGSSSSSSSRSYHSSSSHRSGGSFGGGRSGGGGYHGKW